MNATRVAMSGHHGGAMSVTSIAMSEAKKQSFSVVIPKDSFTAFGMTTYY